ncbi:MAG TPA: energy transducer TonB [Opitutus sp.]|nr:energy transducer TonB [Opitutus sp.]
MLHTHVVCRRLTAVVLITLGSSLLSAQSADFDERPVPVKAVSPVYPEEMVKEKASAIVTVKLVIDENGDVLEQSITKSTRAEFEGAALAAVGKWKFKPARKAGTAVRSVITLPIKFTYEG